ncbi:MAG: 50S ribosomal protein L11 methyltransferase, partial [Acidobacteria bacterium]|nr:50S ribosomal protein L11 methyltransferase [Acidobacteriota bacterium]
MSPLRPDTVLQRVPHLTVRLESDNRVRIWLEGRELRFGPHALAVLDAFARPQSVEVAMERLRTRATGAQDWMELMNTVASLYEAGVLRDDTQTTPALASSPGVFDTAALQVAMLNDRARTSAFLRAIEEVVRAGDVVVDIGTGTGILAMAAARAGARQVYAIEATRLAQAARAMVEANGLADRVTVVEGWSTQVELPEQADVLTSEIIGNEPLAENVLEVVADARKRLLKPGARLIPHRVKIFGLPVEIPRAELGKRTFAAETLENWRAWYGMDFRPLLVAAQETPQVFYVKPQQAREWKTLGEPLRLAEVDLSRVEDLTIENRGTARTRAAGLLGGVLVYFELELSRSTRFSTAPAEADEGSHWRSPVWLLGESL